MTSSDSFTMTEQVKKKVLLGVQGGGGGGWREGRSINTTISFSVIRFYFSFYWFSLGPSVFIRFSTLFYPKGFKMFSLLFYFSLTIKLNGKIGKTSSYL